MGKGNDYCPGRWAGPHSSEMIDSEKPRGEREQGEGQQQEGIKNLFARAHAMEDIASEAGPQTTEQRADRAIAPAAKPNDQANEGGAEKRDKAQVLASYRLIFRRDIHGRMRRRGETRAPPI